MELKMSDSQGSEQESVEDKFNRMNPELEEMMKFGDDVVKVEGISENATEALKNNINTAIEKQAKKILENVKDKIDKELRPFWQNEDIEQQLRYEKIVDGKIAVKETLEGDQIWLNQLNQLDADAERYDEFVKIATNNFYKEIKEAVMEEMSKDTAS